MPNMGGLSCLLLLLKRVLNFLPGIALSFPAKN